MEKTFINPPELYKHPSYTRVITVKGPCKFIYLSGQTPSDENYQPVGKGDYKKQYEHIIDALTIQLKAAGATWADVISRRTYTLDIDKTARRHARCASSRRSGEPTGQHDARRQPPLTPRFSDRNRDRRSYRFLGL